MLRPIFRESGGADGGIPLVRAAPGPVKVRPENPGGLRVPDRDKLIYGLIEGKNGDQEVAPGPERLLPPPEQPAILEPLIDRLHDFGTRFGLGDVTGIDNTNERGGLLPSRQWKRIGKDLAEVRKALPSPRRTISLQISITRLRWIVKRSSKKVSRRGSGALKSAVRSRTSR